MIDRVAVRRKLVERFRKRIIKCKKSEIDDIIFEIGMYSIRLEAQLTQKHNPNGFN